MANAYDIGDVIRVTGTFTDADGTAIDPDTITCKVKDPSGNIASYTYADSEVTRSDTGVYYVDVTIDEAGDWWYRFESTGTGKTAAGETYFWARVSKF